MIGEKIVNKRISARYMSFPYMLLFGLVSFFDLLLRLCKQNKIALLSSHSGSVILCVVPSIVGKLLKIPVVHTQYCEVSSKIAGLNLFAQGYPNRETYTQGR